MVPREELVLRQVLCVQLFAPISIFEPCLVYVPYGAYICLAPSLLHLPLPVFPLVGAPGHGGGA